MRFSLLTSIYAEINKIYECLRGHGHIKSVCRAYMFSQQAYFSMYSPKGKPEYALL